MKVIAIASQKGGVGKTTTSLELASALFIEHDKKVLLIDFCQQCNLTKYVNETSEEDDKTIYDVLHEPESIKDCIRHLPNFDFIASSQKLSKCDVEFGGSEDIFLLDDAFDHVKNDYDFIIIDNGPVRNKLLTMSYVAADYVIAPTDASEGGTDGLLFVHQDLNKLRNARVPLSDAKIIGVVLTRFDKRTNINKIAEEILTNAMSQINKNGFVLPVSSCIKATEIKYARMSAQEYAPYSNMAIDYRTVADAVISYIEKEEA